MAQDEVVPRRLKEETYKMLEKDSEIAKKQPEGRTDEVTKKKFIFNTKGKINKKESKELQRTHKNIFDWVQKEKKKVEEKDCFEKREEIEMAIEPMEVDVMDRQERLDRVKRRAATWETSRICQELTIEMVEG